MKPAIARLIDKANTIPETIWIGEPGASIHASSFINTSARIPSNTTNRYGPCRRGLSAAYRQLK
jgi:hypothetical protein